MVPPNADYIISGRNLFAEVLQELVDGGQAHVAKNDDGEGVHCARFWVAGSAQ